MTRSELHKLVWSRPLRDIAKDFGISDVGLAKLCVRHNIPRPPQGHWARLRAGHDVKVTPLPAGDERPIEIAPRALRPDAQLEQHEDVDPGVLAFLNAARTAKNPRVPAKVRRFHRLLADDTFKASGWGRNSFHINVSAKTKPRLRRFTHVLFSTLEELGAEVRPARCDQHLGFVDVIVAGIPVAVRVRERLKEHRVRETEGYWAGRDRVEQLPTGLLEVVLKGPYNPRPPRRHWRDREKKKLEAMLGEVIEGIGLAAAAESIWMAQRQREAAAREVEAERRRRLARRAEIEHALEDDLDRRARALEVADRLRGFLEDERTQEIGSRPEPWPTWLRWARARVDVLEEQALGLGETWSDDVQWFLTTGADGPE